MNRKLIANTAAILAPAIALMGLGFKKVAATAPAVSVVENGEVVYSQSELTLPGAKAKRTYYLTSEGKISASKPSGDYTTLRASSISEARAQVAA